MKVLGRACQARADTFTCWGGEQAVESTSRSQCREGPRAPPHVPPQWLPLLPPPPSHPIPRGFGFSLPHRPFYPLFLHKLPWNSVWRPPKLGLTPHTNWDLWFTGIIIQGLGLPLALGLLECPETWISPHTNWDLWFYWNIYRDLDFPYLWVY